MSVVCVLTPVVIAAWPSFSTAVASAAASLGYSIVDHASRELVSEEKIEKTHTMEMAIEHSEEVTDRIGRNRTISVSRDGVTVTFSRDIRGRTSLCVTGTGYSKKELEQRGEELSRRVVQHHVLQRLTEEMGKRSFVVVENETDANNAIRLKVRRWEN